MQFHHCTNYINYNYFKNKYYQDTISSLKVIKKKKKSYINFMIVLHLTFFCLNIIRFNWLLFIGYLFIYVLCFMFCNQYEFYISFETNNQKNKYKIYRNECHSFYELEKKLYSNKLIPIKFKNESFIKSYI